MRCTFREILKGGQKDPATNVLTMHGKEIAFVYYRTGYQEGQYVDSESEGSDFWSVREMLECSMAIKCPSIDFQLTTFKKF